MDKENYSCMKYWESRGAKKNYSTPFQLDLFSRHVPKSRAVLDVGCGYGRVMGELRLAGYEDIKGAEPSEALRRRAAGQDGTLQILPMKDERIPCPDCSFDAVLLVAVLTCIPQDRRQDVLIDEIYRVLKPGGVIYVNDFLLNTDQRNLDRYAQYENKYGCYGIFELEGSGVLRHFHEQRILQLLERFSTIEHEKVVYTTMNGNKSNGFYFIGRRRS